MGRRRACVFCGFLPRTDSVISMKDTCFHVSTCERKELFEWKTSVLLERGKVPVISMKDTCFSREYLERKVNASCWLKLDWIGHT